MSEGSKAGHAAPTSPKRKTPERQGLHAWLPYYAGYSEAFVADTLRELSVGKGQVVLDPMNGSGTTTVVAQKADCLALGVEMNPAMAIIARAKDATFAGRECELVDMAAEISAAAASSTASTVEPNPEAQGWIPEPALSDLLRIASSIRAVPAREPAELDPRLIELATHEESTGGRVVDFLQAVLLVTARRASVARESKNPTWLMRGAAGASTSVRVFDEFSQVARRLARDLTTCFGAARDTRRVLVREGDARSLALSTSSIDAIVTSPPYLTRIDYAVSTAPELVLLGYESKEELRNLRREIMGSTCISGGEYDVSPEWGTTCHDVLRRVREHPSKASAGYYLKTHLQYFRDAEASLREYIRVLKSGAPGVLVVQDSWYKDVHVPLDRIYAEMALNLGATEASTLRSEAVRSHLGLVNTRARRYRKGALHEHVVLIRGA